MGFTDVLWFSHVIHSVRVNTILTLLRLIYAELVLSAVVPAPLVDLDAVKLKSL